MTTTQDRLDLIFEDEQVEEVQVKITNAGDGLTEALKVTPKSLHIGERVAFVLRGEVTQVNHKKVGKEGEEMIVRVHTVKTTGITEVEIDMAKRILAANAETLARTKAELEGQMQLDDLEGAEAVADLHERKAASVAVPPVEFTAPTD